MRIQLLPSTFDAQGVANLEQRLTCFLIDDCVAVDAGSIAIALTNEQRPKLETSSSLIRTWTISPACRYSSTIFIRL